MRYHDIVMAVRELIERHWDVYQIASRLKLDPVLIKQIIDSLKNEIEYLNGEIEVRNFLIFKKADPVTWQNNSPNTMSKANRH